MSDSPAWRQRMPPPDKLPVGTTPSPAYANSNSVHSSKVSGLSHPPPPILFGRSATPPARPPLQPPPPRSQSALNSRPRIASTTGHPQTTTNVITNFQTQHQHYTMTNPHAAPPPMAAAPDAINTDSASEDVGGDRDCDGDGSVDYRAIQRIAAGVERMVRSWNSERANVYAKAYDSLHSATMKSDDPAPHLPPHHPHHSHLMASLNNHNDPLLDIDEDDDIDEEDRGGRIHTSNSHIPHRHHRLPHHHHHHHHYPHRVLRNSSHSPSATEPCNPGHHHHYHHRLPTDPHLYSCSPIPNLSSSYPNPNFPASSACPNPTSAAASCSRYPNPNPPSHIRTPTPTHGAYPIPNSSPSHYIKPNSATSGSQSGYLYPNATCTHAPYNPNPNSSAANPSTACPYTNHGAYTSGGTHQQQQQFMNHDHERDDEHGSGMRRNIQQNNNNIHGHQHQQYHTDQHYNKPHDVQQQQQQQQHYHHQQQQHVVNHNMSSSSNNNNNNNDSDDHGHGKSMAMQRKNRLRSSPNKSTKQAGALSSDNGSTGEDTSSSEPGHKPAHQEEPPKANARLCDDKSTNDSKVKELEISLLECATKYEVQLVEMKIKMLQMKSQFRQKGMEENDPSPKPLSNITNTNTQETISTIQDNSKSSRPCNSKQVVDVGVSSSPKRQKKDSPIAKQRSRTQGELSPKRTSFEDKEKTLSSLQKLLSKKEHELMNSKIKEKEESRQINELQQATSQKGRAPHLETQKLLSLLLALNEWLQSIKEGVANDDPQARRDAYQNVHALAHLRRNLQEQMPQENLVSIVNKEIRMLQDILEKLDPQKRIVKGATPHATAPL